MTETKLNITVEELAEWLRFRVRDNSIMLTRYKAQARRMLAADALYEALSIMHDCGDLCAACNTTGMRCQFADALALAD